MCICINVYTSQCTIRKFSLTSDHITPWSQLDEHPDEVFFLPAYNYPSGLSYLPTSIRIVVMIWMCWMVGMEGYRWMVEVQEYRRRISWGDVKIDSSVKMNANIKVSISITIRINIVGSIKVHTGIKSRHRHQHQGSHQYQKSTPTSTSTLIPSLKELWIHLLHSTTPEFHFNIQISTSNLSLSHFPLSTSLSQQSIPLAAEVPWWVGKKQ